MTAVTCPGFPGNWINGWLAAVGATVLEPQLRLHWTAEGIPRAVLSASASDPVELLAERWPSRKLVESLPIEERWNGTRDVQRKVPVEHFVERVREARADAYSWTISSTMTDLDVDGNGEVAHAPFDPSGPGSIKWLHHRLMRLHGAVEMSRERMTDSLMGAAPRVKQSGLGFDLTRMGSHGDKTDMWVDPVLEVLVFFGLALLPVRGRGTDARLHRFARSTAIQRGWARRGSPPGRLRFCWPAWSPSLDRDAIDALLDLWQPTSPDTWEQIGVHAGWRTVQYERKATADPTRGFGADMLC